MTEPASAAPGGTAGVRLARRLSRDIIVEPPEALWKYEERGNWRGDSRRAGEVAAGLNGWLICSALLLVSNLEAGLM